MSFDHQMAIPKGSGSNVFNLAVGEAEFLRQRLRHLVDSDIKVWPWTQTTYPELGGNEELLNVLKQAGYGPHVVVTNGAKQALLAAFYAMQKVYGKRKVSHEPPYWPSYPTLTNLVGMEFVNVRHPDSIHCNTSPNNPDGRQLDEECHVWDAAYANPVYGWNRVTPKHLVSVWSMAKQFGASGLRVGWLCTHDQEVAEAAAYYVEITTSGVSGFAQQKAADIIQAYNSDTNLQYLTVEGGQKRLFLNASCFKDALSKYCEDVRGVPAGEAGMFAWFKVSESDLARFENALREAKVLLVTGEACGMVKKSGWFRMNLGKELTYTATAMGRVRRRMEG